jgi:hypothetical protein
MDGEGVVTVLFATKVVESLVVTPYPPHTVLKADNVAILLE